MSRVASMMGKSLPRQPATNIWRINSPPLDFFALYKYLLTYLSRRDLRICGPYQSTRHMSPWVWCRQRPAADAGRRPVISADQSASVAAPPTRRSHCAPAVIKSNQIKSNHNYFSVAENNNTQYKSIHLRVWQSATEGTDGQTGWH